MRLVVSLRCSDESINPREKFFGAVVSVEDNRDSVLFSKSTDVEGSRDGTSNGCLEVSVIKTLTGIELRSSRRELDDDGGIVGFGGFEACVNSR